MSDAPVIEDLRYCGVPDHVGSASSKWPDGNITWTITDSVPGISDDALKAIIGAELALWATVCGIVPRFVDSASQARILITHRNIDGPMNVLAETELPMGQPQCHLWFDTEAWVDSDAPQGRVISIRIVGLHELGHALGLGHVTTETAVMNPVYNPAVNRPQPWDIAQLQVRYGPPAPKPVPKPPVVPATPIGGTFLNALFTNVLLPMLKAWLQQKIEDGSLAKLLTDLLSKLNTGQITTADDLEAHVEKLVTP